MPKFHARICAPGDVVASPWQNTYDRQDISEEFWLDFQSTPVNASDRSAFTQYCSSNSTIGYFELPNYWNGHVAGELFGLFPPESGPNFSYYEYDALYTTNPLIILDPLTAGVPGPFLTSILAIFGNDTFFNTVASLSNNSTTDQLLCQQLRQPFAALHNSQPTLDCTPGGEETYNTVLLNALFGWMSSFGDPEAATAALTLAIYYSNNAILNSPTDTTVGIPLPLSSDPGIDMQKFAMPLPAMIIITILLATQLTGLALLAWYAKGHHTWTESLDNFAMLRLGAAMAEDMPPVSALQSKEANILDEKAGWIGDGGGEGQKIRTLALGGPERIRIGELYWMAPDYDKDI